MVYCKQCKGIYVEGSAQVAASNQTGILTKEYKTSTTLNLKKHTKLPFTILAAKFEIDKIIILIDGGVNAKNNKQYNIIR